VIDPTRAKLEKKLPDLTDGEWELLEGDGHVGEVESGAVEIEHLVDRVKRLRQKMGPRRGSATAARPMADPAELARTASTRVEALSALLAIDARDQDYVSDFRRRVLRGRLLKPERVSGWVERRGGTTTRFVTTPEQDRERVVKRTVQILDYAIPESSWVQRELVALDSELDHLRAISESLAKRYSWQPGQASTFVLTNLVPILEPIRATINHRAPVRAATRIVLDIDPTTTAREVADGYKLIREEVLGRRYRRMSEKNMRLAIFAAEHQEGTWDERMQAWNRRGIGNRYTEPSNFQRDAVNATRRLLEPPEPGT
jgi:hypothetical protein